MLTKRLNRKHCLKNSNLLIDNETYKLSLEKNLPFNKALHFVLKLDTFFKSTKLINLKYFQCGAYSD